MLEAGQRVRLRAVVAPERFEAVVVPRRGGGVTGDEYRQVLIDRIAWIDKAKRDIKAQIHQTALAAREQKASIDQGWLRRSKDKMDHLTREREEVRKALHTVNEEVKQARRERSGRGPETVAQAFMRIAKLKLLGEVYDEIHADAVDAVSAREDSEHLNTP
jgi:hypothetical protein